MTKTAGQKKIDDGGPAFPTAAMYDRHTDEFVEPASRGMSTRMWLAGMAMQAWLECWVRQDTHLDEEGAASLAETSFQVADALISASNKEPHNED